MAQCQTINFANQLLFCTKNCIIIHSLLFNKVNAADYKPPAYACHLVLVRDAAIHLQPSIWQLLQDRSIHWWLPLHRFNGGNAMPKLYCAFSKDPSINLYVPHRTKTGYPLLAYRAQSVDYLPLLASFDELLTKFGYGSWNYVTIVLYAGEKSGISAHRDRHQIEGFATGSDEIASFVFGEQRYEILQLLIANNCTEC